MQEEILKGWPDITAQLLNKQDLPPASIAWAMQEVMAGNASAISLAGFLIALQSKGASVSELIALADVMIEHSRTIDAPPGAVDIVGTGGDGLHSVNISTMAALVTAGAGYTVVKHGNRASSSKSGSADVLEALGVKLDLPIPQVEALAKEIGITFCFAQTFHPSMRFAAEARQGLKIPTVFNALGPITNPGQVQASAVGVAFLELAPIIAGVFARRGSSALVFRGADGIDEISIAGATHIWEVKQGEIFEFDLTPEMLGLKRAPLAALKGADPAYNAEVVRDLLDGKEGAIRDAVVLNAAGGIVAAEGLLNPSEGFDLADSLERLQKATQLAQSAIDTGKAKQVLEDWVAQSNR